MTDRQTGERLQALLDRSLAEDRSSPGAVLRIESPDFTWAGAAGACDPQRRLTMQPGDAFHAASITKMLTATLCLILAEDNMVDLDRGIGAYLPGAITDGLHDIDGTAFGSAITLRQLLNHRSGLADFFGDGAAGPKARPPFVTEMAASPNRFWSPREVLDWTKATLSPHFPPGGGWHYSDTGYLLAGMVIEAVTGEALHDVLRLWLLAPLGMDHSYLLYRERPRLTAAGRPPSRPFVGTLDYGRLKSASADWGSGGIVTTAGDLCRFIRAFADARLLKRPESRAQMLAWQATGEPGVSYGLGVRHFDLARLGMTGFGEVWGHTGFLKAFMLYWPKADAVICGTQNQAQIKGVFSARRPVSALVPECLRILQQAFYEEV